MSKPRRPRICTMLALITLGGVGLLLGGTRLARKRETEKAARPPE